MAEEQIRPEGMAKEQWMAKEQTNEQRRPFLRKSLTNTSIEIFLTGRQS